MASSDSKVPQFKRVMLKISGEALMGDKGFGLNPPTVERIAREVKSVHELGVEICMVIGGGNILGVCKVVLKGWSEPLQTTWVCLQP